MKIKIKIIAFDLIYDIIGAFFYAVGIYTFAKMANFAPGGLSGLALIMNYLWNLPIGITTIILKLPLMLISYKIVGKNFILKTLKTMVFCTLFLDIIFPHIPVYSGSRIMSALYSGIFLGIGLALFYMRGSSSRGTDFITMAIKSLHPHLSIGAVTMTIDLVIIFLGWPAFGNIDAVLYGLTATLITSLVIDKIMYGIGAGTLLIIITNHGQEIAQRIGELIGRGSTELKAKGSYTKEDKDVLICACSKSQAYIVRQITLEIDKSSFVMITETNEILGEGFSENNSSDDKNNTGNDNQSKNKALEDKSAENKKQSNENKSSGNHKP